MRPPHSAAAASSRRQAHVGDRECTVVRGWQGSAGRLWRRPTARAGAPTAALASPALSACPALPAAVDQAAVAPACAQRGARRAAGGPAAQLAPADAQHGVRERGRVRCLPRPAAGHGRDDGAGGGRDVQRAQRAVREQLAAAGAAPRPARARAPAPAPAAKPSVPFVAHFSSVGRSFSRVGLLSFFLLLQPARLRVPGAPGARAHAAPLCPRAARRRGGPHACACGWAAGDAPGAAAAACLCSSARRPPSLERAALQAAGRPCLTARPSWQAAAVARPVAARAAGDTRAACATAAALSHLP